MNDILVKKLSSTELVTVVKKVMNITLYGLSINNLSTYKIKKYEFLIWILNYLFNN